MVETEGDRRLDVPIAELGGKGVFAKEVQAAVLDGRADLAVHSAKDLPAVTLDGLVLAAVPERGEARDALVGSTLAALPEGATVATGSRRRRVQLAEPRPDLRFAELRGNMRTRLAKAAEFDAIVVAAVAFQRLGPGRPPRRGAVAGRDGAAGGPGRARGRVPRRRRRHAGSCSPRSSTGRAAGGSTPSGRSSPSWAATATSLRAPTPRVEPDGQLRLAAVLAGRRRHRAPPRGRRRRPGRPRHRGRPHPPRRPPPHRFCVRSWSPWQPEPTQNRRGRWRRRWWVDAGSTDHGEHRLAGDEPATVPADDIALERDPTTGLAEHDLEADLRVVLVEEPHAEDVQARAGEALPGLEDEGRELGTVLHGRLHLLQRSRVAAAGGSQRGRDAGHGIGIDGLRPEQPGRQRSGSGVGVPASDAAWRVSAAAWTQSEQMAAPRPATLASTSHRSRLQKEHCWPEPNAIGWIMPRPAARPPRSGATSARRWNPTPTRPPPSRSGSGGSPSATT